PIASTVLRRGEDAKLCSMRITEDSSLKGFGTLVMAIIGLELRHDNSKLIHFTIPEHIWLEHKPFFTNYGFKESGLAGTQYRLFSREIACNTTFLELWSRTIAELPNLSAEFELGFGRSPDILMSIDPLFADKILSGQKTIEIRINFPTRWTGARVIFYASSPIQSIVGEATVASVVKGSPDYLWEKYHDQIGCSYFDFKKYCKNHIEISALRLDKINPYINQISRPQLMSLLSEDLKPPQSYNILKNNRNWMTALTLGSLIRLSL
ncbi:MAG: hypothetical protein V2A61_04425, partial [Calditrichota bacterium]